MCKLAYIILCILLDFPIHIDTISMGLSIAYFKGSLVDFLNYNVFLSLMIVLVLENSAGPGEMQHYAAFHQGLHCLPKYPFTCRGFPVYKGYMY